MSVIASAEIEEALRRVNALAGFYDAVYPSIDLGPDPRLLPVSRMGEGQQRTLQETVLVRSVSIVEAMVQDVADRLLDEQLSAAEGDPKLSRLVHHLREYRMARVGTGSWDDLRGLMKDGLGISLADFSGQSELNQLRTTRHAIVHRLGAVTDQYRKQHRQRLKALGIDIAHEPLIPLAGSDVGDALELCRRTIRWLHGQLA